MDCQKRSIQAGGLVEEVGCDLGSDQIRIKEKTFRQRDPPEQRLQKKQGRAGFAEDRAGQVLESTFGEIPQEERQKRKGGVSFPGVWISRVEGEVC